MKNLFKNIKFQEPKLTSEKKKQIWDNIAKNTILKCTKKKSIKRTLFAISAVASVFAVIAINIHFYSSQNSENTIDYASYVSEINDADMTKGDVTLILSDKKQVSVSTDSTEVVYDSTGKIKVNSQELYTDEKDNESMNQLVVPYGKTSFLTLSDGTKVWVNSGTKLVYPSVFNKNKRELYVQGEAYFDVAKNENQPFIIKTNQLDVTVKGTQLNISAYGNDSDQKVVLVSGKVIVSNKYTKSSYDMVPNQLLSYSVASGEVDIKKVNVNEYITWKLGYLFLNSESLDNVINKINRHFNVNSQFNKNDLAQIRISGKLDMRVGLEEVLKYISTTAPINYSIEEDNVTIILKSAQK